ncbi:MAG: T9SS type A sorting domain-containing protein, partial [Fidelibacterota bacterium]
FFQCGDRDHLAKIYDQCSVVCMNNMFAYPMRGYTWFHDNKPDSAASVRLPFEIDYNYYVTDTSMQSSRDDELLRMRVGPDGYYCDSSSLPGGPHAIYGHPMIARPDSVITPLGDTLTFDATRETMFEAEAAYDSIPDMWFQDAYPLFAGVGVATVFASVVTPEDFMLLDGINAIGAANPDYAPDNDFFGYLRDENPDIGAIEFEGTPYSVRDLENLLFPEEYALSQNYPNPFNPVTTIEYKLPAAGFVKLTVYNLLGQEVIRLVDGVRRSGTHSVTWNSRDSRGNTVPTGIYLCRLEAGDVTKTMKMLLLK